MEPEGSKRNKLRTFIRLPLHEPCQRRIEEMFQACYGNANVPSISQMRRPRTQSELCSLKVRLCRILLSNLALSFLLHDFKILLSNRLTSILAANVSWMQRRILSEEVRLQTRKKPKDYLLWMH